MNIIKAKYEIIEQQYNDDLLKDMGKHIEICGRTCYKSEDKITATSYRNFLLNLENANHGAMLEHGTVYLTIPVGTPIDDIQYIWKMDIIQFFKHNKYSVVKEKVVNQTVDVEIKGYGMKTQASVTFYYITTNYRVIFENKNKLIVKYPKRNYSFEKATIEDSVLQWMTKPTEEHEKSYTVKFTYHLAVARDVNRHRVQSIGEESTRYCNYSKEKYGKELNIIEPIWFTDDEKEIIHSESDHMSFQEMCALISRGTDFPAMEQVDYWLFANMACEYAYMMNTTQFGEKNWTAQKGSLILPLDTKTESVHTAFASDWSHFFSLRSLGMTGAPRPSAKEVAWPLMEEFIEKKYIKLSENQLIKYNEIKNKFPNINDYIKI